MDLPLVPMGPGRREVVRARGWSVTMAPAFLDHGAQNPMMADLGRHTLAQVVG